MSHEPDPTMVGTDEDQPAHDDQAALLDAGAYDAPDPLLDLYCGHRAEEKERYRYGSDAWCSVCMRWVERTGWPEP